MTPFSNRKVPLHFFLILCLLPFAGLNLNQLPAANADSHNGQAFDSLAACINRESTKNVNILFLVDSSASLRKRDGGPEGSGSDPDDLRAGMVRSAIETLEELNNPNIRRVSFAITTFDRESPGRGQDGKPLPNFDWTEATPENVKRAAEWTDNIKRFDYGAATDWVKGLRNAKRELLERAPGSNEERCQAVIWFTDGALDVVPRDNDELVAIEELCGLVPGQNGVPKESVMGELRRSEIHLIGLLLSPKDPDDSTKRLISLLYPTVLGQPNPDAPSSTKDFNCGGPIPAAQGQGYYIEVKDTDELAREFVGMINEIVFGKKAPIICQEGDASFVLDKGIERLVVFIPSKNWQIKLPKNEILSPTSSIPSGATRILVQDKFYQWTFDSKNPNWIGSWTVNSDECPSVFLKSGLVPRLSSSNSSLVAGKENQIIKGGIFKNSGGKPDLSLYQKVELDVEVLDSSEQARPPKVNSASIDLGTSSWQANITPYEGGKIAHLVLRLKITSASGKELPEVRVSTSLDLRYPEDFCSVVSDQISLEPLVPLKKAAVGSIKFKGPITQGSTCQISFKEFRITGDPKNRNANDFAFELEADDSKSLVSGQLLTLNAGEEKSLKVSISDDVLTNGKSRGILVLGIKSLTSSEVIDQSITVDFENKPPVVDIPPIAALTLIGVGLSLALLYLANFLYGRLRLKDLRVANIDAIAQIDKNRITLTREDGRENFFEDKDFKYLEDEREVVKKTANASNQVELFDISVVLPKNPFKDVVAVASMATGRKGFGSEDLDLIELGSKTSAPLNPDGFWVVSSEVPNGPSEETTSTLKVKVSLYLSAADVSYQKRQFAEVLKHLSRSNTLWTSLAKELSQSNSEDLTNGPDESIGGEEVTDSKSKRKLSFGKNRENKFEDNKGGEPEGGPELEKW